MKNAPPRWEYHALEKESLGGVVEKEGMLQPVSVPGRLRTELDDLGRSGWEMIGLIELREYDRILFLFKRPTA